MVRVKHRYLLVDILYPEPSSSPSSSSTSATKSHAQQSQLRIHAPTSDALTPSLLAKMVRDEVAEIFGDWGVGRLGGVGAGGVSVKYLSPATSTAIIRCPRASYRLVWSALTFMSRVPDIRSNGRPLKRGEQASLTRPCVFRVVRVSGTIRKAEEEAVRMARREIVRLRGMAEVDVLSGLVGGLEKSGRREDPGVDDVDVDMDSEDD
ncbi:Rpp14/Pop5 family-domain-containing protein [Aspergillus granulosus]|uniref:Ribonuclease P/MRP protein subunit POP5 n=1 Tax=Aspergillus granulosus TaxID=176169 RepID=A0ABR4HWB0_9EURO